MRRVFTHLLVWSLSPVGTLLNGALLVATLVVAGARWDRPLLWLMVAVFLGASAYFDVRAFVARKRRGLSAYEVGEAVMDHIWGPAQAQEEQQ